MSGTSGGLANPEPLDGKWGNLPPVHDAATAESGTWRNAKGHPNEPNEHAHVE